MSIGSIKEFDLSDGNWKTYTERLEMYFYANNVKNDKRLPTLIAVMGEIAYELLASLASPTLPKDLTYERAVTVMSQHLQPKPSIMAERFKFRQRRQLTAESVACYVAELKRLSKYCDFGKSLEENLRDQFICGVNSDVIRQRLFAEEALTYETAIRLALSLESAQRDAASVEQTEINHGGRGGVVPGVNRMSARGSLLGNCERKGAACAARAAGPMMKPEFQEVSVSGAPCTVCGWRDHVAVRCKYRMHTCSKCKAVGHLRRMCPSKNDDAGKRVSLNNRQKVRGINFVDDGLVENESDYSSCDDDIHHLSLSNYKPVSLPLTVNGRVVSMEVDTGSAISCINRKTYDDMFRDVQLEKCNLQLKCYNGTRIKPVGVFKPVVKYGELSKELELFVIDRGTTSLLGRHWLTELQIPVTCNLVNIIANDDIPMNVNVFLDRYKELFDGGLGRFNGGEIQLRVRDGAVPVYCRARPLPYALLRRVDDELDAMLRDGIIEPVDSSDWATPLVPVSKSDGGLRLCADYKITLNPVLLVDRYPLPRVEDLLVTLNGSRFFSKIDLSQAYNQLVLNEASRDLTVINTHRGLFRYNRLVFGLASSAGIFQRTMTNLLKGVHPSVGIFQDDVIIGGNSKEDHLKALGAVLKRLHESGLKVKKSKCVFLVDEVNYLGYVVSKDGIATDPSKIEAMLKVPTPKNVSDLRSFLGMVNFYGKFVKNLSSILSPLHDLLKKRVAWVWSVECEKAFVTIKQRLSGSRVLAHYDQAKALILTCDASARGVAGVLTQPSARGERPVAYASRSLSNAEKNYSQIDKEALAIIFCLRKFNQYLYGRHFTLRTDHKPLVSLFGPRAGIPAMAASRMQRWALILSAFSYDIEYINTKANMADGLSRLPIESNTEGVVEHSIPEHTYLHHVQDALAIDGEVIRRETLKDPELGRVLSYIDDGWPDSNDMRNLQPFFNRKQELYSERGCIMWGHRVIVPHACRQAVLEMLHEPHMGIVKTKYMARSYVWWPGMDEEIEAKCKACEVCVMEQDAPRGHVPCPWPYPSSSWTRIHVDFMGPVLGKIYLIVVDATSKWLEVFQVPSTSAVCTIEKLAEIFARFGFPKQIVSDNGPPFTSKEFAEYTSRSHIQHVYAAPYHPASNGAAENAVKTVKKVVKKAIRQGVGIMASLNTFLLHYRNTPHCATGESPAQCLMSRKLRTCLDVLKPDRQARALSSQKRMVEQSGGSHRSVSVGDPVWFRQYNARDKWTPGVVADRLGTTDYAVTAEGGVRTHRHIDQLRPRGLSMLSCPLPSIEPPVIVPQALPPSEVSLPLDVALDLPPQPAVASTFAAPRADSSRNGAERGIDVSPVLNRPIPRSTRNKNPFYKC